MIFKFTLFMHDVMRAKSIARGNHQHPTIIATDRDHDTPRALPYLYHLALVIPVWLTYGVRYVFPFCSYLGLLPLVDRRTSLPRWTVQKLDNTVNQRTHSI